MKSEETEEEEDATRNETCAIEIIYAEPHIICDPDIHISDENREDAYDK
jgi:hypothetical protein